MIILTAKQALLRHEASVLAYEREQRKNAELKKKEVIAERMSYDNGRLLDEEKIYKLIKELISL